MAERRLSNVGRDPIEAHTPSCLSSTEVPESCAVQAIRSIGICEALPEHPTRWVSSYPTASANMAAAASISAVGMNSGVRHDTTIRIRGPE